MKLTIVFFPRCPANLSGNGKGDAGVSPCTWCHDLESSKKRCRRAWPGPKGLDVSDPPAWSEFKAAYLTPRSDWRTSGPSG